MNEPMLIIGRWSSKYGDFPAGDPELHHVAGSLYASGMYFSHGSLLNVLTPK